MKKLNINQTIAIALFLIAAGVFVFFAVRAILPGPQEKVAVVIPEGSSVNDIARVLEQRSVVSNTWVFKFYVFASGKTDRLLPGRYVFHQKSPYRQVIKELVKGPKKSFYNLTVPEGFTLEQIGRRISKVGGLSKKEFDVLSKDLRLYSYGFFKDTSAKTLEGYLFPETYRLDMEVQLVQLINMMLAQFQKEYQAIKVRKMSIKLNIHQVVTLASLVEREAKIKEEQQLIAAVIYNRLKKNMKLEIDATIQYALDKRKKKLTLRDLQLDSPYNTYKNTGLPPAPIGSPGRGALKAALKPANVDYLYYVLVDEKTGKHFFTNNYRQFLKVKKKVKLDK